MGNWTGISRVSAPRCGVFLVAMLSIMGAACGKAGREISLQLADYSVTPAVASASPGEITFVATNVAAQVHEVVVLKTDLAPNQLKMQSGAAEVDEAASGQLIGEIEDVEAGKTKEGTFQLTPGNYVLFCNLPGHYQLGMAVAFEAK